MIRRTASRLRLAWFCAAVSACSGSSSSPSAPAASTAPPAAPPPATIAKLELAATSLTGGLSTQGVVTLSGPAARDGTSVTLSTSQPSLTIPARLVVTEGQTTAGFVITTPPVLEAFDASIRAAAGGESREAVLRVVPDFEIESVGLPSSIGGGRTEVGIVRLNAYTMLKALDVTVRSSTPAVASIDQNPVTVAKGSSIALFAVSPARVTVDTPVVITATLGASSRSVTVTVRR